MPRRTITFQLDAQLSAFVAENVGHEEAYETISEYVRDLIRRDKERVEREAVERIKLELKQAYAAPDDRYAALTADDVIARTTSHPIC
jgi:antitoxin ParD1/3/4